MMITTTTKTSFGCVPFGESKNGFLIKDSANFTVERNAKSEKSV